MSKDKEKREYKARRINFEENLRKRLDNAFRKYANGDFVDTCGELQSIWRQAWEKDRKAIIKLIEKRANEDWKKTGTRDISEKNYVDKKTFLTLITSERSYAVDKSNFSPRYHEQDWRDVLSVMNEALLKEHLGKQRTWEERHEE